MRCLSLTQPWASLMAHGVKRIETRSWGTAFRGPLAIHAAKGMPEWVLDWADDPDVAACLALAGLSLAALPRGCVVAVGRLANVERTELARKGRFVTPQEHLLGDYTPGRYAWHIRDVVALPTPVPARGMLNLWEWQPDDAMQRWIDEVMR